MYELKITIDQLKNYLGTGLKLLTSKHQIEYGKTHELTLNGISIDSKGDLNIEFLYDDDLMFSNAMNKIFPICYRLSDLDKFIPELGFVPIEELEIDSCTVVYCDIAKAIKVFPDNCEWIYPIDIYHNISQELFKMHFWPFGDEYFEKGLVIDKLKKDE